MINRILPLGNDLFSLPLPTHLPPFIIIYISLTCLLSIYMCFFFLSKVFEKSARVEQQNEKIADLLARNQKFVEEHNTLLEQRNESFQSTTAHAQARVLELEQEKVKLTDELAEATKRMGAFQADIATMQRTEGELRAEWTRTREESARAHEELAALRAMSGGNTAKVEELTRALKEEKQLRKDASQRGDLLEEQLSEMRNDRDGQVRRLEALRKKQQEERDKATQEMDEVKADCERQLDEMRRKVCPRVCLEFIF